MNAAQDVASQRVKDHRPYDHLQQRIGKERV